MFYFNISVIYMTFRELALLLSSGDVYNKSV
jgi:hypothetical protein